MNIIDGVPAFMGLTTLEEDTHKQINEKINCEYYSFP